MNEKYLLYMREYPERFQNPEGGIEILTDTEAIRKVENEFLTEIGLLYEDEYAVLLKDAVRFPDGAIAPFIRLYHKKPGGISILIRCGDKILLLKHFRHSLRSSIWETPRGFSESDNNELEDVLREMDEEVGVHPMSLIRMGEVVPDAGIVGEKIALYYATIPGDCLLMTDHHEGISGYSFFTKEELFEAIRNGAIIDGITISSVMIATLKSLI